jgi:ABC-2 type transport system ATP-binding protein
VKPGTCDSPFLELQEVSLRYRGGRGVGPLSCSVDRGTVLGLVGGNGAGKTTLLRLICGLLTPQNGSISVRGAPVRPGVPPSGLGAMIEEPPFYGFATGRDNLLATAAGRRAWSKRISECLTVVGLSEAADQQVRQYSQGMRQRLGLARALLGEPELLVLDEPANGLDPAGLRWLRGLVRSLAETGVTVIISSHMLAELGRTIDRALLLRSGELVALLGALELSASATAIEDAYFADQA